VANPHFVFSSLPAGSGPPKQVKTGHNAEKGWVESCLLYINHLYPHSFSNYNQSQMESARALAYLGNRNNLSPLKHRVFFFFITFY